MKNEMTSGSASKARWMVVDDDDGVREFIAALLETTGRIEVESFSSSSGALIAFGAGPEKYQFIVTDFDMPGMNGVELCRRIHAVQPAIKVLLVTGQTTITATEARLWGFCGLVKKPFLAATFREALEEAC